MVNYLLSKCDDSFIGQKNDFNLLIKEITDMHRGFLFSKSMVTKDIQR